jgi:flagellar biosynthesis protein FlhB
VPQVSEEELRALAPNLPAEQFAALTSANVVIVNPEHISVVIQFDPVTGAATVVAKGGDDLALEIRAAARAAGIPVVQNPELAQALFTQVAVGGLVPPALLGQVTDILAGLTPTEQAFEPGGGEFQPGGLGNPQLLLGAGIIAAAIAVPIAVSNDDETEDQRDGS